MTSKAIFYANTLYTRVAYPPKHQSFYGLFATLVLTIILALGMSSARAELVDLSTPESVIEYAISDTSWLIKPDFRFDRRCLRRLNEGSEYELLLTFIIDEQGEISKLEVIKSSGDACLDRMAMRQAVTGRLKPLTLKGQSIKAKAVLPLKFVIRK